MIVELIQPVHAASDISKFLGALPASVAASDVRMEWCNDALYCIVRVRAQDAYAIDCGDHMPGASGKLPQDILIALHSHDGTD